MLKNSMITIYPLLTILSTTGKRSFTNLGRLIGRSRDTIRRTLYSYKESFEWMQKLVELEFKKNQNLVIALDDTLIRKIHSKWMVGAGWFYDTKLYRSLMSYKLIVVMITDGRMIIPIGSSFVIAKELIRESDKIKTKEDIAKELIKAAVKRFSEMKLKVAADGAYATASFMKWCTEQKVDFEIRMASNRKVEHKGNKVAIKEINELKLKGRQQAKTVKVLWHDMSLFITVTKDINKNNEEVIRYLASNYEAKPFEHAKTYRKRWLIEKAFRTSKHYLGLQECYSRQIDYQLSHAAAVFVAYTIAQLEQKKRRLKNPEEAIKAIKLASNSIDNDCFHPLLQQFGYAHA